MLRSLSQWLSVLARAVASPLSPRIEKNEEEKKTNDYAGGADDGKISHVPTLQLPESCCTRSELDA